FNPGFRPGGLGELEGGLGKLPGTPGRGPCPIETSLQQIRTINGTGELRVGELPGTLKPAPLEGGPNIGGSSVRPQLAPEIPGEPLGTVHITEGVGPVKGEHPVLGPDTVNINQGNLVIKQPIKAGPELSVGELEGVVGRKPVLSPTADTP